MKNILSLLLLFTSCIAIASEIKRDESLSIKGDYSNFAFKREMLDGGAVYGHYVRSIYVENGNDTYLNVTRFDIDIPVGDSVIFFVNSGDTPFVVQASSHYIKPNALDSLLNITPKDKLIDFFNIDDVSFPLKEKIKSADAFYLIFTQENKTNNETYITIKGVDFRFYPTLQKEEYKKISQKDTLFNFVSFSSGSGLWISPRGKICRCKIFTEAELENTSTIKIDCSNLLYSDDAITKIKENMSFKKRDPNTILKTNTYHIFENKTP